MWGNFKRNQDKHAPVYTATSNPAYFHRNIGWVAEK